MKTKLTLILAHAMCAVGLTLKRWALRRLRGVVDAADEWLHAREIAFRESRMAAPTPVKDFSVDRTASAARERAIIKARPARLPRLKYVAGEFVRQ